ncbi:hypothetical protein OG555_37050 [Kribbella sp. NBC_01484]|uniref:hypothetical protein n=1 Tax=Kribbella sp. NBC_01484 TaxID=2903579 RepID=UPI002E358C3B|nr:hypothetical protein [Kribbella sp. NBC_01484]
MTLSQPSLDDRRFDDLFAEARSLIPTYKPEWTDHNPSDPGITLLELFAWLAEMLIYRADQVPARHRLVFLRLLNGPDWTPTGPLDEEIATTLTRLRSRYRAVTSDDFEALALAATTEAVRALALPMRDLGAGDEQGRLQRQPGYVSVIVLPGDDVADEGAMRDTVRVYLEPRRLLTVQHVIAQPVWAPVTAEVLVARRADVPDAAVRDAIVNTLTQFLDPRVGGRDGTGWPFGRDVYVSELYSELQGLSHIDYTVDIQLDSACLPHAYRCVRAEQLWDNQGDQIGLQLAPHHLPQATISPDAVVVARSFLAVRAVIGVTPVDGVMPTVVRRAVKDGLRILFHPLHNGPTGDGPWTIGSDRVLASLRARLAGVAKVTSVYFEGDPARVTTDERGVITVYVDENQLIDLQTDVVVGEP